MRSRRVVAVAALVLGAAGVVLFVTTAARGFPRGLVVATLLVLSFIAAWEAIWRRGRGRTAFAVIALFLLAATLVVLLSGRVFAELIVAGVLAVVATVAARRAFLLRVALPPATPPNRAVMVWNPRSGGGKATAAHLDDRGSSAGHRTDRAPSG